MTSLLQAVIIPIVLLLTAGRLATWLLRSRREDDPGTDATPTVTVVTPMFNEGASIRRTIRSILAQDYPADRLRLIVVDDCSTDDSYDHAIDEARGDARVRVLRNEINQGKRASINRAVRETDSEIIVSVDSDVELEPDAIRHLLRRFTSPRIAAVGGRVDIRNKRVNWLTRMQAAKYYYDYHVLKTLEREFASVMCLSGCLTAYRRHVLVELSPILETRNILGVPIKYGEDRFLTRQIVKRGYRTVMTMDAMCFTKAPTQLKAYFNQQLRWKRSNIVDFIGGIGHAWRLHPLLCVQYLSMLMLLFIYPFVIISHVLDGSFFDLAVFHLAVIAAFSLVYYFSPSTRRLPPWLRVHPAAFLPMAVLMPVAYLTLTPLGMFTLDTSSWETRGHVAGVAPGPGAAP